MIFSCQVTLKLLKNWFHVVQPKNIKKSYIFCEFPDLKKSDFPEYITLILTASFIIKGAAHRYFELILNLTTLLNETESLKRFYLRILTLIWSYTVSQAMVRGPRTKLVRYLLGPSFLLEPDVPSEAFWDGNNGY